MEVKTNTSVNMSKERSGYKLTRGEKFEVGIFVFFAILFGLFAIGKLFLPEPDIDGALWDFCLFIAYAVIVMNIWEKIDYRRQVRLYKTVTDLYDVIMRRSGGSFNVSDIKIDVEDTNYDKSKDPAYCVVVDMVENDRNKLVLAEQYDKPLCYRLNTPFGYLIAGYCGDPGIYEGISVDLETEDGIKRIAVIETAVQDYESDDPTYPTKFHTLAYDGVEEEPHRIDFDENGPMADQ